MRSPTLIALGSELRRYRLAAGNMTQGHLAMLINYSEGMISNVETAQKVPRRDFVERCDKALETGGALLVLHGRPPQARDASRRVVRPLRRSRTRGFIYSHVGTGRRTRHLPNT
jgi:Helix-turn-helix domain